MLCALLTAAPHLSTSLTYMPSAVDSQYCSRALAAVRSIEPVRNRYQIQNLVVVTPYDSLCGLLSATCSCSPHQLSMDSRYFIKVQAYRRLAHNPYCPVHSSFSKVATTNPAISRRVNACLLCM